MPEVGEIKKPREIGYKGTNSRIWHACEECGRERWVVSKNRTSARLNCQSCANRKIALNHFGEKSNAWRGGRLKISHGYIRILLQPDSFFYSMVNQMGYVLEHRLVVAKALGRCLHSWEIVHHLHARYPAGSVEDKQDNRYPENLQLVQEMQHKQITIMERRIHYLAQRVVLIEAENVISKQGVGGVFDISPSRVSKLLKRKVK